MNPKYPFLSASVDALVTCSKCGTGVVEIKCPYKWRQSSLADAVKDKDFCCQKVHDKTKLKETHNYMYQVMGQMAVTDLNWADFVVWTKVDINVERIHFDEKVWNFMLEKLQAFYVFGMVAEILSCRIQRGKTLYPETQVAGDDEAVLPCLSDMNWSHYTDDDIASEITSEIIDKSLQCAKLFEESDDEDSFYGF